MISYSCSQVWHLTLSRFFDRLEVPNWKKNLPVTVPPRDTLFTNHSNSLVASQAAFSNSMPLECCCTSWVRSAKWYFWRNKPLRLTTVNWRNHGDHTSWYMAWLDIPRFKPTGEFRCLNWCKDSFSINHKSPIGKIIDVLNMMKKHHFKQGSKMQILHLGYINIYYIPPREPTYPTWGKGKSSSNMPYQGDMLIPWRVYI